MLAFILHSRVRGLLKGNFCLLGTLPVYDHGHCRQGSDHYNRTAVSQRLTSINEKRTQKDDASQCSIKRNARRVSRVAARVLDLFVIFCTPTFHRTKKRAFRAFPSQRSSHPSLPIKRLRTESQQSLGADSSGAENISAVSFFFRWRTTKKPTALDG